MSLFIPIQEISFVVQETLSVFEAAALITGDGQILGMKYVTVSDIGNFGPFSQITRQYFKILPGDVVLTNDPYSGGTNLSTMSLITPFQIADQVFYLATRVRFIPRLAHARRLEDEGIRIPPTPIAAGRKINEAILSAIGSHPLAPPDFAVRIEENLNKIWRQIDLLKTWAQKNPSTLSKSSQKALLQETQDRIKRKLNDLPHGDHRIDLQFETGEIIRMRTEIQADEVHFDFAGTSTSKRLFLTNTATYGSCMAALLTFLNEEFLLNEGIYSIVNVTTPQGCFLNAQYPSPVYEGIAEAASVLASGAIQSLSTIASSKSTGQTEAIPTILHYDFASGKTYYDILASGTSANANYSGVDAHFFWYIRRRQPSIETVERDYPMRILQSGIRQGSAGKGKLPGGNGTLRETELLEDCTLKWLLGARQTQNKGLKGGSNGLGPEITILKANGEKQNLAGSNGEIKLQKGDKVIAGSAGGGGYGKAAEPLKNSTT